MPRVTKIEIPVLLPGGDYRHVMGSAELLETDEGEAKFTLTVSAAGRDASDLVAILTNGAPYAVSLAAIPVTPRSTKNQ
jgi:hypothetical protein